MTKRFVQTTIMLPPELKHKARVKVALQGTSLSHAIREMLTAWVEEDANGEQPGKEASQKP